jgi:hypothetical protein
MKRSLSISSTCGALVLCALLTAATPGTLRAQDACSHPITPQQWAAMTPNQRSFQQQADTATHYFIEAVFGSGPYPPCLYQSVRDYFTATSGATPAEQALAQMRRERLERIMSILIADAPSSSRPR